MSNSKSRIKQEQMHNSYIKQVSSKSVIKTIVMGRAESGPKVSNTLRKATACLKIIPPKKRQARIWIWERTNPSL